MVLSKSIRCEVTRWKPPNISLLCARSLPDYDGISHELFQIANNLERMDQFNPSRSCSAWFVTLKFPRSPCEISRLERSVMIPHTSTVRWLICLEFGSMRTHDWLKITVPAILPKRNQRDNQAFLTRPLRYALLDFLKGKSDGTVPEAVLSALSITTMRHSASGAFETMITSKPRGIWM